MDFNDFYKKLGLKIKFLREEVGLTQENLAEKAGISIDYLGKIEVNINRPGLISLLKIANALGIEPKDLLDFDLD
ncbi:MAG: helix-turn-helix transcriptional regulator [Candidatus Gastranaerophilales bacterium]|nr:helix-turn-helix transcriptional regulator [Candidatus Gastranaerophilales bacterium]